MAKSKAEKDSSIVSAEFIRDNPKKVCSISPAFDEGLCGGLKQGSLVIVSGHEGCGKSYTSMYIVKRYLEQFPESKALWVDVENRLQEYHTGMKGLDGKKIDVLRSSKGNILFAEGYLDKIEKFIKDNEECIVVVDSISMLSPENESAEDVSAQIRASAPKLMAHFLRKIAPIIPVQDAILIFIAHISQDMSVKSYVPIWKEDGGRKMQYAANTKIMCKKNKDIEVDGVKVGKEVEWHVGKNCLGPDGVRIKSYIRYGDGIDVVMELIDYGLNFGLISLKGAWYKMDFVEALGYDPDEYKAQGMENLRTQIDKTPELFESLKKQVQEFQNV